MVKKRGVLRIANDGGDDKHGEYTYFISQFGKPTTAWKTGRIVGFPRKQLGVWDLLHRVIVDALGEERTKSW
jgi:hypothetical protein